MNQRIVAIDGGPLTPEAVVAVADRRAAVQLADTVPQRMAPARQVVEEAVAGGRIIYGVTTGFGALADTVISREQLASLQHALLRSHAAGVGPPLPRRIVRALLLLRARTLAQGHSGVRPLLVDRLVELLRRDLLPVVPERGSVTASGDLAPFAHLALPLIGEGLLDDGEESGPAGPLLGKHGFEPLVLEPKEGLSLLNGTEGTLAFGVLGLHLATTLAKVADIACALSVEALLATDRPFQEPIHELRPHPGQLAAASNLARLLEGSEIVASHRSSLHAVQDAYSLRCAPQVHGAARDVLSFAEATLRRELGSVVDNPIILPHSGEIVSGGNFHGQPLGFALDFMAAAVTELGSISERRTDRILDPQRSAGLPPFLATKPGVNSGYMLTQYTAARSWPKTAFSHTQPASRTSRPQAFRRITSRWDGGPPANSTWCSRTPSGFWQSRCCVRSKGFVTACHAGRRLARPLRSPRSATSCRHSATTGSWPTTSNASASSSPPDASSTPSRTRSVTCPEPGEGPPAWRYRFAR